MGPGASCTNSVDLWIQELQCTGELTSTTAQGLASCCIRRIFWEAIVVTGRVFTRDVTRHPGSDSSRERGSMSPTVVEYGTLLYYFDQVFTGCDL